MPRSATGLIYRREMRDLLRDRRTIFLILGLPLIIYPVMVLSGVLFALNAQGQRTLVGLAGGDGLPPARREAVALLGGTGVSAVRQGLDLPALLAGENFSPGYVTVQAEPGTLSVTPIEAADADRLLAERKIDLILTFEPDFAARWDKGERPKVRLASRDGDESSKLALKRVQAILKSWQADLRKVRFTRQGLPSDFDQPIQLDDESLRKPPTARSAEELRDSLVKSLPFLLLLWTLTGALHPAVDLTAGEKERGTMETLLISPAQRREIVAGKFWAVFSFSYLTTLWNVMFMAIGLIVLGRVMGFPLLSAGGLLACLGLSIPLAMLFSALCVALGVYARTTKEGQYYLMPLMLIVMPLGLFSLTPGLKLTPVLAALPVTNLLMIEQRMMSLNAEPVPIWAWAVALTSAAVCVTLALLLARWMFNREAVLFREAGPAKKKSGWFARRKRPAEVVKV